MVGSVVASLVSYVIGGKCSKKSRCVFQGRLEHIENMPIKTHAHHRKHIHTSQQGFIAESSRKRELISGDLKNIMNKQEKIIMGALIGGILIFLIISIVLLFTNRGQNDEVELPPAISGGSKEKVVLTPYPTLPPIENMTVVMNSRRFVPDVFNIKPGGFVDFLNLGSEPITIEANDAKSEKLNIGSIRAGQTERVTFESEGVYTFRNKDNPAMIGIITVK